MLAHSVLRAALVALLMLALAPAAHAGDDAASRAKARDAYRRATHHYDFGEYRQALEAFKEAYSSYEDAAFLFNIAQCHRQLGETAEAIRVYRAYLRNAPRAPNREEVKELIAKLEQQQTAPPTTVLPPAERPVREAPESAPPPAEATQPQPATTVVAQPAPEGKRKPVYKQWWLWTTVAAVAVVGVGLGVGLSLGLAPSTPSASTDLGTRPFP